MQPSLLPDCDLAILVGSIARPRTGENQSDLDETRVQALLELFESNLDPKDCKVQPLWGSSHHVSKIVLPDSLTLYLHGLPPASIPLLRHERLSLENEAVALNILRRCNLPIPRLLYHSSKSSQLGMPFVLTTVLSGEPLSWHLPLCTDAERTLLESQLQSLKKSISRYTSDSFGPVALVADGKGSETWREAFGAMMSSILKDGEDAFVNLPYVAIREITERAGSTLDEVVKARLFAPGLSRPSQVFVERDRVGQLEIVGLLNFRSAIWGDVQMEWESVEDGSVRTLLYVLISLTLRRSNHAFPSRSTGRTINAPSLRLQSQPHCLLCLVFRLATIHLKDAATFITHPIHQHTSRFTSRLLRPEGY